jgi:HrpA-like RNA helicase
MSRRARPALPVLAVAEQLLAADEPGAAVLAPPGTSTTGVPPLLAERPGQGARIVVVEPRRLGARQHRG